MFKALLFSHQHYIFHKLKQWRGQNPDPYNLACHTGTKHAFNIRLQLDTLCSVNIDLKVLVMNTNRPTRSRFLCSPTNSLHFTAFYSSLLLVWFLKVFTIGPPDLGIGCAYLFTCLNQICLFFFTFNLLDCNFLPPYRIVKCLA